MPLVNNVQPQPTVASPGGPFADLVSTLKGATGIEAEVTGEALGQAKVELTECIRAILEGVVAKVAAGSRSVTRRVIQGDVGLKRSLIPQGTEFPKTHFKKRGLDTIDALAQKAKSNPELDARVQAEVFAPIIKDLEDAGFENVVLKLEEKKRTVSKRVWDSLYGMHVTQSKTETYLSVRFEANLPQA